ncbi:MAG: hypothetical protein HY703_10900 [Gemmatimonadetes bacterium]|nr:hypothetical protein [Gemmatimonadota bacterium]
MPDAWIQAQGFRGSDKSRMVNRVESRSFIARAIEEAIACPEKPLRSMERRSAACAAKNAATWHP